jgi:tripartite-type tricarboxylate transporter receptor subunit TctC
MRAIWLAFALASSLVQAQEFPTRAPIEITVLFPAGSSADVTARMLADGMSRRLNQRVLVVNRPGAGGAIGYKHVAIQRADGYSLVWNSNSISTTYHSGQLPFDYTSFEPVARVLVESVVLAVRADAKWKTLAELVADAKARPKAISIGHSGAGSHTHLSLAALTHAAGMEANEVPFAVAQVVPSLIGGHVDAVVQFPAALAAPLKQGQAHVLVQLTSARDPAFPEVPTAREQGFDVALDAWRGIAAPKGTPASVIGALERAIKATAESEEFAKGSANLAVRPGFLPAKEFGELVAKDDAAIARLMQEIGLKK